LSFKQINNTVLQSGFFPNLEIDSGKIRTPIVDQFIYGSWSLRDAIIICTKKNF